MTPEEINAFLDLPLTGAIATLRDDGSPHVVPVWYRWDGAVITVWADATSPWVKRVRDQPRVAFTVFEHGIPSRAVYIRGTATVVQGPLKEFEAAIRPVTARYVAAEKLEETLREYDGGNDKAVVTITPEFLRGVVNG